MNFSLRIRRCACIATLCVTTVFAVAPDAIIDETLIKIPDIRITPVETPRLEPSLVSEYSSGETIQLVEPVQEPIFTGGGRVILSSVSSYSAMGDGIGKCSLVARKNLDMLLRNLGRGPHRVYQGDATELIINGLKTKTIEPFSDKKSMFAVLDERKKDHFETVFDAYRRNTPSIDAAEQDIRTRRFLEQGHRAVIFLGDDEQWYILDTIDGKKTATPQLLSDYLPKKFEEKEWFLRTPGYSGVDLVSNREFDTILPFLSPELQLWWKGKREFVTYYDINSELIGGIADSQNHLSLQ